MENKGSGENKKIEIKIHELTQDPTAAWKVISEQQTFFELNLKNPVEPVQNDKVRFVCMSDTHSLTRIIRFDIPDGDIFIHAGDFTNWGHKEDVIRFNEWLGRLPHKHKIVIAGNHDLSFDTQLKNKFNMTMNKREKGDAQSISEYLTNCIYLEDSGVELYGIKLYGTPWQPEFGNWAFNLKRGEECLSKWNMIPEDTDILITHGPPIGHGDIVRSGARAGCVELLSTVQQRVKPKYHIFGHIHEGYGVTSDGEIIYINASTCDINNIPNNLPVVFDVPLKEGVMKEDVLQQPAHIQETSKKNKCVCDS